MAGSPVQLQGRQRLVTVVLLLAVGQIPGGGAGGLSFSP